MGTYQAPQARPTTRRPPVLAIVAALIVVALVWAEGRRRERAILEAAYSVNAGAEVLMGQYARAFDATGPAGVALHSTDLEGQAVFRTMRMPGPLPWFSLRRGELRDLATATRHVRKIVSEPSGSWVTFTAEKARAASDLDRALAAVETAAGPGVMEEAKARGVAEIRAYLESTAATVQRAENRESAKWEAERQAEERDLEERRRRAEQIDRERAAERAARQAATEPTRANPVPPLVTSPR
ncbi:MAG: hypothetical protein JNK60_14130 [Acidobacteria bacterium]|nr:hypothetical protein [Acidobacteriota bacterium]